MIQIDLNKQRTADELIEKGYLHKKDKEDFELVCKMAYRIANAFNLDLKVFEPKRRPHPYGAWGLCYVAEKRIGVVFRHKEKGKWLDKLSIEKVIETTCHELAHLRHPNHGKDFKELEQILCACRIRKDLK